MLQDHIQILATSSVDSLSTLLRSFRTLSLNPRLLACLERLEIFPHLSLLPWFRFFRKLFLICILLIAVWFIQGLVFVAGGVCCFVAGDI